MPDLIPMLAEAVWLTWLTALTIGLMGQLVYLIGGSPAVDWTWRAAARIHQELWIAAPAGLFVAAIQVWRSPQSWMVLFAAANLWPWWYFRNWPDENRWKRRGRKLKDAVVARAGRLVVVPT
jgi:hypothetical protein